MGTFKTSPLTTVIVIGLTLVVAGAAVAYSLRVAILTAFGELALIAIGGALYRAAQFVLDRWRTDWTQRERFEMVETDQEAPEPETLDWYVAAAVLTVLLAFAVFVWEVVL